MLFTINYSTIIYSKSGGEIVSSIDLAILGIVMEKPQSAYDIEKDIEYHHFQRWTRISVSSIYKKVLRLKDKGYLSSTTGTGDKSERKTVYYITERGRKYFGSLMEAYAQEQVNIRFDFNTVITNLNKMDKPMALELIKKLRNGIVSAEQANLDYAEQYQDIPLVGKTIFEQQRLVCHSLLEWVDNFEAQFACDE